jgi:hypothetical protein
MVLFGLHDQHQKIHEFRRGLLDLTKETVKIELSDGDHMQLDVDLHVWNGDIRNFSRQANVGLRVRS